MKKKGDGGSARERKGRFKREEDRQGSRVKMQHLQSLNAEVGYEDSENRAVETNSEGLNSRICDTDAESWSRCASSIFFTCSLDKFLQMFCVEQPETATYQELYSPYHTSNSAQKNLQRNTIYPPSHRCKTNPHIPHPYLTIPTQGTPNDLTNPPRSTAN